MNKVILVIEDEEQIRLDLVRTLTFSGYDVIDAPNGELGLLRAQETLPDLIISDIMMPILNGYDVLKELQKDPSTAVIPFLFLSAKSEKFDIRDGINLGADQYLTKPYDIDELLTTVEARLKKREMSEKAYNSKMEDLRSNIRRAIPHEIRTPLNIILGLSEFLKNNFDKTTTDDAKEMLSNIYDGAQRLHRLFENYLYYANLEILATNKQELDDLHNQRLHLSDFFIKEIVLYRASIYDRTEDIKYDIDEAIVAVNEEYLMKVIEEIIDNCLKFSDKGSDIKVIASVSKNKYIIEFSDFGRGMSKVQIDNLGAYVQFERKVYEQQGNGLGIAIAKRITELHNGTFEISSEPGRYTSVKISLPIAK